MLDMLRKNWDKYLHDPASVDKGEFISLLTDSVEGIAPEEAFHTLPNGVDMARRCRKLIDNTIFNGLYYLPDEPRKLSADDIKRLAYNMIDGLEDYLRDIKKSGMSSDIERLPVSIVSSQNDFQFAIGDSYQYAAVDLINDMLVDKIQDADERLSGAKEAILGLTMDAFTTNHIITAAVNFHFSWKPGFDLYIGGRGLAILEEKIIILCPHAL